VPARKAIRLPRDTYEGRGWYFLTLCCHDRRPLFRDPEISAWLVGKLKSQAADYGFLLHAWCVMPDHLHLLVEGASESSNVLEFIACFKQCTGFEAKRKVRGKLWQRYSFDHVLRPNDSLDPIAWYIWMNPVRANLCAAPEDYPFSGSLTFEWKRKNPPIESWVPPWKV
jgi:putative transposase